MTFRQKLGLRLPPILLRLALATTFIWSGSGKFWGPVTLSPAQEATLSAIKSGGAPAASPNQTPAAPDADNADQNADQNADENASSTALAPRYQLILVQDTPDTDADQTDADQDQSVEKSASKYHTVDLIALQIHSQATPNQDGKRLLPAFMGRGKWPIRLAYAVGVTELLGGIMLLLGLFTRLWSLGLAGVMVGALWMTAIGPVVVYGETGWPGFLPVLPAIDHFDIAAWMQWILQLNLLAGALSLACLGAGGLSFDRLFFPTERKTKNNIGDEDE